MDKLKIIVFAGLPLTGKTTLSRELERLLSITRIDIDEIRQFLFKHHPVDTERDRDKDAKQMFASWQSFFALVNNVIAAGLPVIVAGTFSRKIYHYRLMVISEYYNVPLKVIHCSAPDEVITQRMELRNQEQKNPSNLKSMEGYYRVKARYVKFAAPNLLDVDTSEPIERCLAQITDFIEVL